MITPTAGAYLSKSEIPQSAKYLRYYSMKVTVSLELQFLNSNLTIDMPSAYRNFTYSVHLITNGNNLSSSDGYASSFNMTALREILLIDNTGSVGGPINDMVIRGGGPTHTLLGTAYDRLYGYFVTTSFHYSQDIGGNGSPTSPAQGQVTSDIQSGYLLDGYLAYNMSTSSTFNGPASYISSREFPLVYNYSLDLLGGRATINNASNWLRNYYNSNTGGTDSLVINTIMSLESTNIAFVPYYRAYITSGVLVSLIPFGFAGLLYLGQRKEWYLKNNLMLASSWVIVSFLMMYAGIVIYY